MSRGYKMAGKGTPPYIPTKEVSERVKALKAYGATTPAIARMVGVSEDTLERHHKDDLRFGLDEANSVVAKSLFDKAVLKGDTVAMIFWLKTRARWKTADNESLLESNDSLKEDIRALRAKLDLENKKEY